MLSNKKAFVDGVPKILNFLMALVVLAGGALPLLATFGIIGELPSIPTIIIQIITAVAGILLLMDGFMGSGSAGIMPKGLNLATAVIVLIGGVVPLLSSLGVIGTIPEVPLIVFQGLLVVAGVILLLDGVLGVKDYF